MREVLRVARWRRGFHGGKPVHPSELGFWALAAKLKMSRTPTSSSGAFTAIILVHRRPANLDMQVRAALHAPSVGEVIVSCNNPEVDVRDWTAISSPRLRVLTETGRNQTRRYAVALASDGDRFVLPDDDVLYSPDALDEFCRALPANADHPIGLAGQRLNRSDMWESAIYGTGEEVDVLNRAYVCTRAHAEGVFRNAELLGWTEGETFSNPADDVLVSFAGQSCPTLRDFDHVNCVSNADANISTYRQADFHGSRSDWVADLRKACDRDAARRDQGAAGALSVPIGAPAKAMNVITRPLRRGVYVKRRVRNASFVPPSLQRAVGLRDGRAFDTRRAQIGMAPAPLRGFLHVDDNPTIPDLTVCSPLWRPEIPDQLVDIVAFGALDRIPPHLVPMALATWRALMVPGGRLIVGVRDSGDVLLARDALVGARSWASQLPAPTEALTSPLQLIDRDLTGTLWDEALVRAALDAQGFNVVATLNRKDEIDTHPDVSPWTTEVKGVEQLLEPVPAILDGAAELIVVARAR